MATLKTFPVYLEKITRFWAEWSQRLSLLALGFLVFVTLLDILSSKLFHKPVDGSIDIIARLFLVAIVFSLAKTQLLRRHIQVDLVTRRISKRRKAILEVIGNLLISLFLVAAIWGCFEYAFNLQQAKEDSPALGIPSAPFVYAIAIAFCPIVMIHVTEVVTSIRSGKGVKE